MKKVETNKQQFKEAYIIKNKNKIPLGDALHIVISKDNNSMLVSRDKHILELNLCKKPEDLI